MNNIEDRTDHKGNVYETIEEMCKAYNIPYSNYKKRMSTGWGKEEALTKPVHKRKNFNPQIDHLGNRFNSIAEMCTAWKLSSKEYIVRRKRGYTLEEALTGELDKGSSNRTDYSKNKDIVEYLSRHGCSSITEFANKNNISVPAIYTWLKRGITIEEALDKILKNKTLRKSKSASKTGYSYLIKELNGYGCKSIAEFTTKNGIDKTFFYRELKKRDYVRRNIR